LETQNYNLSLFLIFVGVLAAGLGVLRQIPSSQGFTSQVGGAFTENPQAVFVTTEEVLVQSKPLAREPLLPLNLQAASVLVKDLDSGILLFEKEPEKILPIASLTKLMTAIVVYQNASPSEEITVTSQDTATVPYRANFVPGQTFVVSDLLSAMLVSSANDAALALARHVGGTVERFVTEMNNTAQNLGMTATHFTNPIGLDDPLHYSTASDLARLVEEFLKYPEFLQIVRSPEVVINTVGKKARYRLLTTNKLMLVHPEIRGLKTGYTDEAKGNLIILTDRYYAILLGSREREREMETLMDWLKENYSWEH
jgi:D-alanyl-D-alanine carboxypeptidase